LRLLPRVCGGQPEEEIRLAVMVGESIYANVRLRLKANRTYELDILRTKHVINDSRYFQFIRVVII